MPDTPPKAGDRFTVDGKPNTVAAFLTVLMARGETRYLVEDARYSKWILRRTDSGALVAVPMGPDR